eukprot:symbB.v1.2.025042.t1/scaffold2409.1/size79984/10
MTQLSALAQSEILAALDASGVGGARDIAGLTEVLLVVRNRVRAILSRARLETVTPSAPSLGVDEAVPIHAPPFPGNAGAELGMPMSPDALSSSAALPTSLALQVGGAVLLNGQGPTSALVGQRGVITAVNGGIFEVKLDSGLTLGQLTSSCLTLELRSKVKQQAGRLKVALEKAAALASTLPSWATLFWQSVKNEADLYGLEALVREALLAHGYVGPSTVGPPRVDELKKQLTELESYGGPSHGLGAALLRANAGQTVADPEQMAWHLKLPADLQRAGPELYRNIRAEGVSSVRQWVNEQHAGLEAKSTTQFQDLFTAATIIDFELAGCRSESELMAKLATSDTLEIHLRKLGAFIYYRRTKDKTGANRMLGVRAPGTNADIAPKWMLDDANTHSKTEYQRLERGQKFGRLEQGGGGSGSGAKGGGKQRGGGKGRMKVTAARQLAVSHILSRVALEVRARRSFDLTGVQPLASLLKASLDESGYVRPAAVRQVAMVADRMVEPKDDGFIDMLEALPAEDAVYYEQESNVVETGGKCSALFEEIESHYGFIGGELEEFLRYLRRPDVTHLWEWDLMSNIKAVAGVSVVLKKNGFDQRKLIMQFPVGWLDGKQHPPLPAVQAWDLLPDSLKQVIDNKFTTMVSPKYLRLAMGGSHSVYILMRINLQHIGRSLYNYASRLRLDGPVADEEKVNNDLKNVVLEVDDDEAVLADEEWVKQRDLQKRQSRALHGWTVDEWVQEVRRTKHHNVGTFVVIHMFGGERRKQDIQEFLELYMEQHGLQLLMISVDLAMDAGWDFSNPATFSKILGLAEEGLIDAFLGGPPCSTVARSRFVRIPGGPRPLRFRWALWGRADLFPAERVRVEEANVLWLNFMAVAEAVASRGGAYLWEHPSDPGCSPFPSIWITEEMMGFESRVGGRRAHLHQCPFGGISPKPTTLSGNLDNMEEVNEVRCPGVSDVHQHGISIGRQPDGGFYTRRLQTYPPKLCEAIAKMIMATLYRFSMTSHGPTGPLSSEGDVPAPRVTAWSTSSGGGTAGI